eukprot:149980_1
MHRESRSDDISYPPVSSLVELLGAPTASKPRRPSLVTLPARHQFCGFGEISKSTTPITDTVHTLTDSLPSASSGRPLRGACSVIGSSGLPDLHLCTPSSPHNAEFGKHFCLLSWPTQSVMASPPSCTHARASSILRILPQGSR